MSKQRYEYRITFNLEARCLEEGILRYPFSWSTGRTKIYRTRSGLVNRLEHENLRQHHWRDPLVLKVERRPIATWEEWDPNE